jgi:hypothetical protein
VKGFLKEGLGLKVRYSEMGSEKKIKGDKMRRNRGEIVR